MKYKSDADLLINLLKRLHIDYENDDVERLVNDIELIRQNGLMEITKGLIAQTNGQSF